MNTEQNCASTVVAILCRNVVGSWLDRMCLLSLETGLSKAQHFLLTLSSGFCYQRPQETPYAVPM
jgi:hypothetical protein